MGTPGRAPAGIGARPVSEPPQLGWPDVHGGPCDRSWVRAVLLSPRAYPMQRRAPQRRQNGEVLFVEDVIRLMKAEIRLPIGVDPQNGRKPHFGEPGAPRAPAIAEERPRRTWAAANHRVRPAQPQLIF